MARKSSAPPQPPEVTRQQDPMQEYTARAAGAGQGAQPTAQAATGMEFAKQKLASISNDLLELAKVLAVEKPALMPILQRMAGFGSQLDKLMATDSQGQGNSQAVNGAEPPQGSQTAPEAPGAMGM